MTTELLTKLNVDPLIHRGLRYQAIVAEWPGLLAITDAQFEQALVDAYEGPKEDKTENARKIMNACARGGQVPHRMDCTAKYYAAATDSEILTLLQIGKVRLALIARTLESLRERD